MKKKIDSCILRELNDQNMPLCEMAKIFSVVEMSVRRAMRRDGIKPNWRLDEEYIINEYLSGMGSTQIGIKEWEAEFAS